MLQIKVPTVGESISEVSISRWNKKTGDYVEMDELLCELESDKATFELNAEAAGVLTTKGNEGDTIKVGDLIAEIDTDAKRPEGAAPAPVAAPAPWRPARADSYSDSPAPCRAIQPPPVDPCRSPEPWPPDTRVPPLTAAWSPVS